MQRTLCFELLIHQYGQLGFIKRITVFDTLLDISLYVERWKERFCSVLNREDPENTAEIEMEQPTELDTECSEITEEEIRQYIRKLKRNKPTGSDNIKVEVIKESEDISANLLHTLFNKIWGRKVSEQQKKSPSK